MGSFLSIPVTQKPEIYELPSQVQRDDDEIFQEFNENICKTMRRQNLRSRQELNLLNAYRRNWSSVVEKLMKKYPKWSSEDILNLRYRYEIVAKRYGYLLHFCNLRSRHAHGSGGPGEAASFDLWPTHTMPSVPCPGPFPGSFEKCERAESGSSTVHLAGPGPVGRGVCPSTWSKQRQSFTVDRSPKIGLKNFNGFRQMGANWSKVEVRIGGGKQMDCRRSRVSEPR
ncbi:uncharacterized protein isoform X2 [Danio rerio]|uniref:Uncharacterized protein isoform X2 n=1 Tax=Danio rerio TaxID=7955 RepID=A0AB32TZ50_DANRE